MQQLNRMQLVKRYIGNYFHRSWQPLNAGQRLTIGISTVSIGLVGLLSIMLSVQFGSNLNFEGCSGGSSKDLNLPVEVMPNSCKLVLKADQQRNISTVTGLTQMAGLSNAEFYVLSTTESKEKVTQYYEQQLRNKGFRVDPSMPGNAGGMKINLSGVSMFMIVSYTQQQASQLVEGDTNGKNIYVIMWQDGQFSTLMGK